MSPNTFFDQFAEKRQGEEISNFLQKVYYQSFCSVEKFFFQQELRQHLFFIYLVLPKKDNVEKF